MKIKIYSSNNRLSYFLNSINNETLFSYDSFISRGTIIKHEIIYFHTYEIPLLHLKFDDNIIYITMLYDNEAHNILDHILNNSGGLDKKINSYLTHNTYGKGQIININSERVYIKFQDNVKIFPIVNVNKDYFRNYSPNDIFEIIKLDCIFKNITKIKKNYISKYIVFHKQGNILSKKTIIYNGFSNELNFYQLVFLKE